MNTSGLPTIFPESLSVHVSTRADGTVLDRAVGIHDPGIVTNRTRVCEKNGFSYGDVVYQRIVYSNEATYSLIADADERSTTTFTDEVVADALFTMTPDICLMLPVADCIATVVYDPKRHFLAVAHMGRHSTLTDLLEQLISHFVAHGSMPSDLLVWMSPSAQRSSYKMEYFDHEHDEAWQGYFDKKHDGYYLDMQGYNKRQLINAGVLEEHIEISSVDTVTDTKFFSHSAGDTKGRFAVMARMHAPSAG